jgi:hypothetical protein
MSRKFGSHSSASRLNRRCSLASSALMPLIRRAPYRIGHCYPARWQLAQATCRVAVTCCEPYPGAGGAGGSRRAGASRRSWAGRSKQVILPRRPAVLRAGGSLPVHAAPLGVGSPGHPVPAHGRPGRDQHGREVFVQPPRSLVRLGHYRYARRYRQVGLVPFRAEASARGSHPRCR